MSLFDGLPLDDGLPPCTVTIKRASNGSEIMICSITPPAASAVAEARSRKLPLFTMDEIGTMRRITAADSKALDAIIATRLLMGWGGPISYQEAA